VGQSPVSGATILPGESVQLRVIADAPPPTAPLPAPLPESRP
jgi:hypothetical protein